MVPEMRGKPVYQLNYRWPALEPAYPMTRLVDELVQIADGVYLGQLVMATDHYSLGPLRAAFPGMATAGWDIGEPYRPGAAKVDYGYQNNGFFLMIDPEFAREAYAEEAFPQLRPRPGESGYTLLGYDRSPGLAATVKSRPNSGGSDEAGIGTDWISGWQKDSTLTRKFTTILSRTVTQGRRWRCQGTAAARGVDSPDAAADSAGDRQRQRRR